MNIGVKLNWNAEGIDEAIVRLLNLRLDLKQKADEICNRLASIGAVQASLGYARAFYSGDGGYDISVEPINNGYAVKADGEIVLFLEFGAGVTMGYGHPQADEFGMGPGTYPGQTHAFDPNGWWFTGSGGSEHTFGNPPTMAMYNASKDIQKEVERVCREVLSRSD